MSTRRRRLGPVRSRIGLRSATVILVSCQTRGPSLLQTESSLRLACSVLPCPCRADRVAAGEWVRRC